MANRFIIGRAGSGKTHRCLDEIRARLRQDPVEGPRILFIVPEQASFQMERALIETPDIPGFCRCEVLSFQRLAHRVFSEAGADPRRTDETIGHLGRLMLLRRLIRQERAALQVLGRVADKPGLIRQVAASIEELMREDVAPDLLAQVADRLQDDSPLEAAKLADLNRLYQAYLDSLVEDRMDPAQYLHLAAERSGACGWLDGAEIWVDGFAGFTAQEYHLLTRLAARAATFEITLLVEPDSSALHADRLPEWSFHLFSRTERTMIRLRREFATAGLGFNAPVALRPSRQSRFQCGQLARLERELFKAPGGAVDGRDRPASELRGVSIIELPDRRCEVDAAIAEIDRLRREADPPMRYRDIAIIVRDLAPYHDLLSAGLAAHHIPCFIDRRQPTTQHPLIELVRGMLSVAAADCRLEDVRLVLKTGLLPISHADADLLENYLLAHGIAGRSAWDDDWHYTRIFRRKGEDHELSPAQQELLKHVNTLRRRWLAAMSPWLGRAAGDRLATGKEWACALYACLDHLEVARQLHQWADAAEADGRRDEADMHRQVWADFVELLDEFVRALGTEGLRVREFQETIEAGLAEFNLGLAPAMLDQVLIGAIERSRHPPVRAVILLGFDDRHYPVRRGEPPLLGDREREALEASGAEISPPRGRQLLEERMLAYIAMTRASERLVVMYPRAEADGQPVQASPYLRDVLAALPGLNVQRVSDPRDGRSCDWLTSLGELGGRLAREFRYRPTLEEDEDPPRRAAWNALYEQVRRQKDWRAAMSRSLGGLQYGNAAQLEEGLIRQAIGKTFAASVSRLERFAACPFSHYIEYLLRLEPRVEPDMADVDLGNLCHSILEKFIGDLASEGRRLAEIEDDDINARVQAAAEAVIPKLADDMILSEARNAFLLDRSRGHLRRVLRWQRDSARAGSYRPYRVEYPFGYPVDGSAPFKLTTPSGRTIFLRGRIDRIDIAEVAGDLLGVVIDYKHTTERTLDLAKTYHGLTLQLVGYLLALQQAGATLAGRPIRPVAAFYLPLLEPHQVVAHPTAEKKQTYRWRGIADCSALASLDSTVGPGARSQYLNARLNQGGTPDARCDLAASDHFEALMGHVGRRLGELADRLLDGEIGIEPYRLQRKTPCSFCSYKPVCRYEIELQAPRSLAAMKKPEVFEELMKGGRK